jgi:hypothetical protein
MHCVDQLFLDHGPGIEFITDSNFHFDGRLVKDVSKLPFRSDWESWDGPSHMDWTHFELNGQTGEPLILSLGSGYMLDPPQITTREEHDRARLGAEKLLAYQEDFAILLLDHTRNREKGCVPVARQEPKDGEEVWAVGFPQPSLNKGGQLYVSNAHYYSNFPGLCRG